MPEKSKPIPAIKDALSLDGDPGSIRAYYARWAESYDQDVEDHYTGPQMMVGLLMEYLDGEPSGLPPDRAEITVADAGCGTGLVGKLLHGRGFRNIDGMDISREMVDKARELGVYRALYGDVDMTEPLRKEWVRAYHVVLCCGVFTLGHVPPTLLHRLFEMVQPGGIVITSTRTAYFDSTDYGKVSENAVSSGRAGLIKVLRDAPYTDDGNAHYWIYRLEPD